MDSTLDSRIGILRFAAAFLWADHHVDKAERSFFFDLAQELGFAPPDLPELAALLATPPAPEAVDPTTVRPRDAGLLRDVALRAIAADGHVATAEMDLFELLDELLPKR